MMRFSVKKIFGRGCISSAFSIPLFLLVSASICVAEEEASHGVSPAQLKDFGWRVLCFAVLVAILWWGAKKADIKGLLAARRDGIAKALQQAAEAREEAESKLAEYNEKLEKATREIDEIYEAIKLEGEAERNRIIAEAKETADRIREQASLAALQEVQTARARLQAETAKLAVQLAEETLKRNVTKLDQDRFVDEYLSKVVEA
jgi:F-type H+-transporting ATPase subunit b